MARLGRLRCHDLVPCALEGRRGLLGGDLARLGPGGEFVFAKGGQEATTMRDELPGNAGRRPAGAKTDVDELVPA